MLAALLALGVVAQARAINGGPRVASTTEAPWSVLIEAGSGAAKVVCSGSILDATRVLTAAHCTLDDDRQPFPPSAYVISAGIDEFDAAADTSQLQQPQVASVARDPGFVPGSSGDDIAVLTLSSPLDFSGAAVAPISLVALGAAPPVSAHVTLYGFGHVNVSGPDGFEHALAQKITPAYGCYSGIPSIICARTPTGTACPGDSGGGLVVLGPKPVLVAVDNYSYGPNCTAGDRNAYTDLASPEIALWLAGEAAPPKAPRTVGVPTVSGAARVGATLSCKSPAWSASPTVSFQFVDPDKNVVLQQGARRSYLIRKALRGHRVECVSIAVSSGGTSYAASTPSSPIAAAKRR